MDLKNTLAAVSLSAAIIVIWGLFMQPSPQEIKETVKERHLRQSPIPVLIENQRKTLKRNREKLNNLKI